MVEKDKKTWKDTNMLKDGEIIRNYEVLNKISQGGFGQVYKVKLVKLPKTFPKNLKLALNDKLAIKVESKQIKNNVLSLERDILNKFYKNSYFMQCIEYQEYPNYYILVQNLGKTDLQSLVRSRPSKCLNFESTVRLSQYMIQGIKYLHEAGFIHRDIKLSNFLLADPPLNSDFSDRFIIKLIDFGVAKRVITANGILKTAEEAGKAKYVGTVSYSSIRAQELMSPWKSDDLVSCYFCFINMLDPDLLNWRRLRDNKEILKRKKEYSAKKAHTNFPPVAQHFFDEYYNHIISLDYGCEPDYSGIKAMTKNLLKVWNITSGMPYEWEDVDDTPKKPKEVVKEKPNIVKIKEDENNAASWVNRLFINRFLCNRAVVN